ncbi:MAG: alpha-ketoglutarate-dependent dioxygenase AlkB [Acidimicrobiia bacterium]
MPAYQATLLGGAAPGVAPEPIFERITLDARSWVDVSREWLLGADTLLDGLIEHVDWRQGRRKMWDRMIDDPRLSRWYGPGEPLPHPGLARIGAALAARYDAPLAGPALNYYRDGDDSVAPHADRELRVLQDTLICIVTLGARRPFLVKPKSGGPSRDLAPGSGDLLVMGGATQIGFTHAVPKVVRAGPRVSMSWRWSNRSGPGVGSAVDG